MNSLLFDATAIQAMKQQQEQVWSDGENEITKRIDEAYTEKFRSL